MARPVCISTPLAPRRSGRALAQHDARTRRAGLGPGGPGCPSDLRRPCSGGPVLPPEAACRGSGLVVGLPFALGVIALSYPTA